jgi:hypothetical protein
MLRKIKGIRKIPAICLGIGKNLSIFVCVSKG